MPRKRPAKTTPSPSKKDVQKIIQDIRDILTLEVMGQEGRLGKFVMAACEELISNPRFAATPAAVLKHHAYPGGLALHTLQVLRLVVNMANACPSEHRPDRLVLFYAAIFHDAGKMIDYETCDKRKNPKAENGFWFTQNHNLIGHLIGSHKIMRDTRQPPWEAKRQANAEHCVLAHHGRLEWGSPVTPSTVEAWILHLADMLSSRFDDPTEGKRK